MHLSHRIAKFALWITSLSLLGFWSACSKKIISENNAEAPVLNAEVGRSGGVEALAHEPKLQFKMGSAKSEVTNNTTKQISLKSIAFDEMMDAKPFSLPTVKPAADSKMQNVSLHKTSENSNSIKGDSITEEKSSGTYQIQLAAISNMDEAKKKQSELQAKIGSVQLTFDPPFYKLRYGYFHSPQEAQDKILELNELKIQGFVVKR